MRGLRFRRGQGGGMSRGCWCCWCPVHGGCLRRRRRGPTSGGHQGAGGPLEQLAALVQVQVRRQGRAERLGCGCRAQEIRHRNSGRDLDRRDGTEAGNRQLLVAVHARGVELDQQLRQDLLEPCLGRGGEAGRTGTPLKASVKLAWPGRPSVRLHTRSTPAEVPRFMSGPLGSRLPPADGQPKPSSTRSPARCRTAAHSPRVSRFIC